MAGITSSAAVAIPSFTGLKSAGRPMTTTTAKVSTATPLLPKLSIKASLKEAGVAAVVATAASAILAGNAMAIEVLLGSSDGELVFEPSSFSVAAGEKIVFKNNAGFPHNVVFNEDEVPSGVDATKISMSDEDLLNAPGETYAVTLTEKGFVPFAVVVRDRCFSLPLQMDRYQRVEKPWPKTPIKNEIRITTQGRMRNYIIYATTLFKGLGR